MKSKPKQLLSSKVDVGEPTSTEARLGLVSESEFQSS